MSLMFIRATPSRPGERMHAPFRTGERKEPSYRDGGLDALFPRAVRKGDHFSPYKRCVHVR